MGLKSMPIRTGKPRAELEANEAVVVTEPHPLTTLSAVVTEKSVTSPAAASLAELQLKAQEAISAAQSLKVVDQPSFELAASLRQQVRRGMDLLEALLRPEITEHHEAHKRSLARLNKLLEPFKQAEALAKAQQDAYQRQERERARLEKEKLEQEMKAARDRLLAEQLAAALEQQDEQQVGETIERLAAPAPVLPSIARPVKAAGSSARTVQKYELLDVDKIDPRFIVLAIKSEISKKGECEWLNTAIQRAVTTYGKEAERLVGEGSIRWYEDVSTGVRR